MVISSELNKITYRTFYIYIVTDRDRDRIEIDATGDLSSRLMQLNNNATEPDKPACIHLVYWESHRDAEQALERERTLKRLSRKKQRELITNANPEWAFLNEQIYRAARLLPDI